MKNPPVVEKLQVRYQGLDPYGHVNNAFHIAYFESVRLAYLERIAEHLGLGPLEAGELPGVRYVIAEATVRYKAPIRLGDALHGAASIGTIGNRSFVMDYELRAGESFENAVLTAEGTYAQVFYDPKADEMLHRPDWFLSAVAAVEGRPEESFAPEAR